MNLGACWQNDVWADGSWVEGVWCPDEICTPESIGECWSSTAWCSGTWQVDVWCPVDVTPPTPTPTVQAVDELRFGPSHVIYTDDPILKRKLREEDEIIIL